ncbi:DUF4430 domain-containing protein [Candidatus Formimonas warabiya]|uniref:Transcobalamin-like C-terminal domain-containing protein n=1 Tax=Formimonas warabiya TaxID=1761012 RepID=A0A3G1KYN4_FORW1|nr:DUF4430 domain-containing protein [Candidatus Formimonas warabiya]ATW27562.1 hypothetical protein DCMF_24910 [Candidatus Formimonas warabiya]
MKITKNKVGAALIMIAVLAAAYIWGGGYARRVEPAPQTASVAEQGPVPPADVSPAEPAGEQATPGPTDASVPNQAETPVTPQETGSTQPKLNPPADGKQLTGEEKLALAAAAGGDKSSPGVQKGSEEYSEKQGMAIDPGTGKDKYQTAPVPEGKPVPVEPKNAVVGETAYTCTLSVECSTILDNIKNLDKDKKELVPEDGIIFPPTKVTFYEGESVFNVLQREMKRNKIHMEFVDVPIYNSAYIEGINNLYEFDCGELSGWMYTVNDWFPNYGCSRYQLKDGDVVKWLYTCDLGRDVGGYYAVGEP